ncbi:hypothetical protein V1478_012860, partial [Vespula squamosa]
SKHWRSIAVPYLREYYGVSYSVTLNYLTILNHVGHLNAATNNEEAPKYRFEVFGPKDSRGALLFQEAWTRDYHYSVKREKEGRKCGPSKASYETIYSRGKQCAVGRQRVPTSTPCVSMRTTPTAKLAPDYTSSPLANFPLFRTASASFVGDHPPPPPRFTLFRLLSRAHSVETCVYVVSSNGSDFETF